MYYIYIFTLYFSIFNTTGMTQLKTTGNVNDVGAVTICVGNHHIQINMYVLSNVSTLCPTVDNI